MKNKYSILSFAFSLVILAAITLQSVHSFHHLEQFLKAEHCHHHYAANKTEINHTHHDFDHCFACELTMSNCVPSQFYSFEFNTNLHMYSYSSTYSKSITQSYRGALFALRAPPVL